MNKEASEHISNKDTSVGFRNDIFQRWLSGIPYEVAFWRSYYRNKKSLRHLMRWSQYKQECELDNFDVASYVSHLDHDPVIVDVGCALSYIFGSTFAGKEYPVVFLDPLASFYNQILDDYSLDFPRIRFGMGETLSLLFPENSVSLFHIRNALDHSVRPMMIIWQALIGLRVGGILYLNHKPNEAEHEDYIGFHQYNIDCRDGKLIIWNREEHIDVADVLSGVADVDVSVTDAGRIVAIIRKTAEVPQNSEIIKESTRYAAEMLQSMMSYFHSTPCSMAYQLKKCTYSALHTAMRLLPMGVVVKLKRFLTQK